MAPFGVFATLVGPGRWPGWRTMLVGMAFATLDLRVQRPRARAEASFGLIFRLGLIPLFLFSGRVLPDQQPRPVRRAGRPAARRCGTASTCPGCSASTTSTGPWPRSTSLVLVVRHGRRLVARRSARLDAEAGASDRARPPATSPLRPFEGTAAARAAQLHRLPRGLEAVPHRLPRAGLLPVLDRHRRRQADPRASSSTATRSPTPSSSRPGMLAASAFNGALLDSTFNVFFKLKYEKLYDQMLATPLTTTRHRPRRDPLGPAARRVLLRGLPGGDVGARAGPLVVGGARAAGDAADRLRLQRGLHGADDLHEVLAGLRQDHAASSCRCSCSPARSSPSPRSTACCGGSSRSRRSTAVWCSAAS